MNIWLLMTGEPLEIFGERPHRIGMLSKMLVEAGHSVHWWTSTYDHQHKKYLHPEETSVFSSMGVEMIFLHSNTAYTKNVSLKRMQNHKEIAKRFKILANERKTEPDIIMCCYPTIDLAYEAVIYGKSKKIPVVIDVRDLWPDSFKNILPSILRPILPWLLFRTYKKSKYIFNNAFAISGITDSFVNFGLNFVERIQTSFDRSFPFGYPELETEEKTLLKTKKTLEEKINFDCFIVCFFGTIGKQFEFDAIIEAANNLENDNVVFLICGKGSNSVILGNKTLRSPNIILTGWLNHIEIATIMHYSNVGIAPYVNSFDFLSSLSNKPIEYLAGSLPILSSINGVLGELIVENECGFVYDNSSKKLTEHILLLKNNEALCKAMSFNARKVFNEKFSDKVVYGDMIDYLSDIVKKKLF